ncbi:hypothetical protein TESG_03150 [Trichophyton tonsurans CBS 112818]|uniref:Uncharacterized protein n=1 Tax=Trichophyton tonsurans (strain CBS 112818) TaxID=647933 RepID=F2RWK7_TRIT1|nr:hypothetical protein TESG_03150 [Trichophyton tonsurans CBS 112818]
MEKATHGSRDVPKPWTPTGRGLGLGTSPPLGEREGSKLGGQTTHHMYDGVRWHISVFKICSIKIINLPLPAQWEFWIIQISPFSHSARSRGGQAWGGRTDRQPPSLPRLHSETPIAAKSRKKAISNETNDLQ